MTDSDIDQWKKRIEVVGKAQARYLWVLLIVGLFYWTLQSDINNGASLPEIKTPIIGVNLSGEILLASGPSVIFLLIIIIYGTFRAFGTAVKKLNLGPGHIEPYDLAPNAIDFAAYNPKKDKEFPASLFLLAYPLYLSIFWFEAIILLIDLITLDGQIVGELFFIMLGSILGVFSTIDIYKIYRQRLISITTNSIK